MICPHCYSDSCRRSHRRRVSDFILTILVARPWRCRSCQGRFYAWKVPLALAMYAHCPHCGNFDLRRISRDRVEEGAFRWVKRLLGFPAYRCAPCRARFFSVLPYNRIIPDESAAVSETTSESQHAV